VNIVDAEAAIVCSIGLDHADWLGTDIEGIGREKAGVLRAGALAVLADPDMTPSVEAEARRIGSRLVRAGSHYRWQAGPEQGRWHFQTEGLVLADLPLPALPGNRQLANAAAAIVTLQRMGVLQARHAPQVARALAGLALPGRLQILPGRVQWVLDVAHNEAAARVLAQSLAERPVAGRTLCVSGILADKDVDAIARALESTVDAWFLCGIAAPRGLAAGELAARSPVFGGATLCADVAAGMRAAAAAARPGDRILVCGSFLVVSPALALLGLY
jgi:dihydrofolate synthase/folylpolyglutamate synthase